MHKFHAPESLGRANSNPAFCPPDLLPLIETLREFFASKGVEAYLVGGVIRDAFLQRPSADIDVAMAADVPRLGRELATLLGGHFVLLDATWDMARTVLGRNGGSVAIDLNPMPDGIGSDLGRRDLTVDAMAISLDDAVGGHPWDKLIDPFDGQADLRAGVVRAVTLSVFEADPVRLIRAPRLAAQLGFRIDEDTARQVRQDAHLVATAPPERVRDELMKLLTAPGTTTWLRGLFDLGLLLEIVPELSEAIGVTQPREHYWNVFDHLLETTGQLERILQPRAGAAGFVEDVAPRFESMSAHFQQVVSDGHTRLAMIKLAGLLHDVAKPATKTVESSGRMRFLGHHTAGAVMAEAVLKRLRFSGRGIELVRLMVEHHLRPGQMAQEGELPTGRAIDRYFRDTGDAAIDTLYLNMADFLAARGPALTEGEWTDYCRVVGHILREGLEQKAPETLSKLLTGHDIMRVFCLSPGPEIGRLLAIAREAQANGEIATSEEALALVKAHVERGGGGA